MFGLTLGQTIAVFFLSVILAAITTVALLWRLTRVPFVIETWSQFIECIRDPDRYNESTVVIKVRMKMNEYDSMPMVKAHTIYGDGTIDLATFTEAIKKVA